ncbi:hypothetical protein CCACVL1_29298 [Corchorus capsularis]|uniref:MOSC domain-containing protein n=1 Tax=Corchorus capsularis TaxID=210143 RepID=A0A1R3G2E6_COCAP|nr:hypothetical protein CCACVL1_29298 [Corchorus capsularis]
MAASASISLHHVCGRFTYPRRERGYHHGKRWWQQPTPRPKYRFRPINASVEAPAFPLLQPPAPEESPSLLEPADPDFYKIGYVRSMRAYGIQFKEGPDGFGVYASKDVEPLRRARVVMEIPLELMLTIRQKLPWMFFPDIVPIGHPIFDIINSTNPETDSDLRMACLLLYALDRDDNFWQLYGDFLPSADECTSLLLATEEDLSELQDADLASTMRNQQKRAFEFWQKNWHSGVPLKIKRLARDPERFIWAVSIAQSRCINMQVRIGALVQDANMLIPYADMLNHSYQPNCFLHWRFKDRMVEVMINAGQRIKKGDENPWDSIPFSGNAQIHLDSFLSVFNISGLPDEYYHNSQLADSGDNFVDGAVIAAARTLPTWSDGDVPPIPTMERKAVKELQEECQQMLAQFPTTSKQDQKLLDSMPDPRRSFETAIKYRLHRKLFIEKIRLINSSVPGFRWDRNWLIVNQKGRAYTQRVEPKLALVEVHLPKEAFSEGWEPTKTSYMEIKAPGMDLLKIPLSKPPEISDGVSVWEWSGSALDEGDEASEWFTTYIGKPSRLVRFNAASECRPVDPVYANGHNIMFSDGFPFMMISQESLDALNKLLKEPVPINRFRPNILVGGCEPFAEDLWTEIKISEFSFKGVRLCSRCKMPTINQDTAIAGPEPNETLMKVRSDKVLRPDKKQQGKFYFGQNLVCTDNLSAKKGKMVKVGDPIFVLQKVSSAAEAAA